MLSPTILAALLSTCAPNIDPVTETALITVESGGDAWALHQNTPDRSFSPNTYQEAIRIGTHLLTNDHSSVDVGLTQVNSRNFATYAVTLHDMLDPCTNLRVGAAILAADYRREWAATASLPGSARTQTALRRALQDYNAGAPTAAPQYTAAIMHALGSRLVHLTLAATSLSAPVLQPPVTPAPKQTPYVAPLPSLFRNIHTMPNLPALPTAAPLPGALRLPSAS